MKKRIPYYGELKRRRRIEEIRKKYMGSNDPMIYVKIRLQLSRNNK